MKRKILSALTVIAMVLGLSFAGSAVMAAPGDVFIFNKKACDGNTTVCPSGDDKGLFGLAKPIINTLLVIAGIVAVIVIIVGGISYTVSAGDPAKVKKAKDTVLYAVIGLVVAILAFSIVNFVVDRL